MHKENYIEIAKILARNRPDGSFCMRPWEWIVNSLCLYFKQDNLSFDPVKFRDACKAEVDE